MKKCAEFRGEITVFLSLILTVVLALILGTIESARIAAVRAQAERSLYLAQESVLASYNIPLKEWYHVFAVDGGETPGDINFSLAEGILSDYAKKNFSTGGLFGGEFSDIRISTVTLLTDYGLKPLKKQITEYMGRTFGKEAIQNLWTSLVSGGENLEAVKESQLQLSLIHI